MARTLMALALTLGFTVPAFAADTTFALTGDNTKIEFVGTKPGGKHEGGFKKLVGTATVTDGVLSKIDIAIECDSLYSDDEKLTSHLKAPDFFDVKNHTKAMFKSTKIEKSDKGFMVEGDLTMLGKSKAVKFPASVSMKDGVLSLSTAFTIDRTEWGMTYGDGKIDKPVALKVSLTAKK